MEKKLLNALLVLSLSFSLTACTVNIPADIPISDISETEDNMEQENFEEEVADFITAYKQSAIPDFQMRNCNGDLISLTEIDQDYVIYFGRIDCEWCDKALSQIETLKDEGVLVVSVYRRDYTEDVKEHLESSGYSFDEYTLCGMSDPDNNNVLDLFDLVSVPTVLTVKNGIIDAIKVGTEDDESTAILDVVHESLNDD